MKFIFAFIYMLVYGEWKLMSNEYEGGRITPEEYERDYGTNRSDIQLRCPHYGSDGKLCGTILEFTHSTERTCAFFSTKDNHEHALGCFLRTGGKKRKPANADLIREELDFNSFFGSSNSKNEINDDIEEDDVGYGADAGDECSGDNFDAENIEGEDDFGIESEDDDSSFDESESVIGSGKRGEQSNPNIEKLRGFAKTAALVLDAAPNWATNNGYLVNDSTICKRTAEAFNEGLIEMKEGDPMLVVARKWGGFSYEYSNEIGADSILLRNQYIEKEYLHVFELKFDKLGNKQRKKFFKVYGKDESRNYNPQAFIMGVIYLGTRRKVIGGRERLIDTFSLQNVSCFTVFDDKLKEIDDKNMLV